MRFFDHIYLVVALKGLAERLALFFLKYFFMLGENTGIEPLVRMRAIRFTGARLPFGVSSSL